MSNWYITPKENDLMHYGVKGMKWRYKKGPTVKGATQYRRKTGADYGAEAGYEAARLRNKFSPIKANQKAKSTNTPFEAKKNKSQYVSIAEYALRKGLPKGHSASNVRVINVDPKNRTIKVRYTLNIPTTISQSGNRRTVTKPQTIKEVTKTIKIPKNVNKSKIV